MIGGKWRNLAGEMRKGYRDDTLSAEYFIPLSPYLFMTALSAAYFEKYDKGLIIENSLQTSLIRLLLLSLRQQEIYITFSLS